MQHDQISREIAAAYTEDVAAVQTALRDYAANYNGPVNIGGLHVRNLSPGCLVIEGRLETGALHHLERDGFIVTATSELALVRRRRRKVGGKTARPKAQKDPASRALEALRNGKEIKSLHVFNDEFSIRTARKLWQEYVEAEDYRFFAQFLHDLDKLIMQARAREGHHDETDDDKTQKPASFEDNRGGRGKGRVTATLDGRDPEGIYDAHGNWVGTLADIGGK